MNKIGAGFIVATVLFSTLLVHSRLAQKRRDAAYRGALASFQLNLRAGMTRAEVETYLKSRQVQYQWIGGEVPGDAGPMQ